MCRIRCTRFVEILSSPSSSCHPPLLFYPNCSTFLCFEKALRALYVVRSPVPLSVRGGLPKLGLLQGMRRVRRGDGSSRGHARVHHVRNNIFTTTVQQFRQNGHALHIQGFLVLCDGRETDATIAMVGPGVDTSPSFSGGRCNRAQALSP